MCIGYRRGNVGKVDPLSKHREGGTSGRHEALREADGRGARGRRGACGVGAVHYKHLTLPTSDLV